MISLGIVCLTIIVVTTLLRRRGTPEELGQTQLREIRDQLQRLEQAVDSIALETERISEGQRFTAKLLSDSARVAPGPGAGQGG